MQITISPTSKKTYMKTSLQNILLLGLTLAAGTCHVAAQGTAFTYQGRLNDGAVPANGLYDLQFSAFTAITAGTLVAGPTNYSAVPVTNGLFTVTIDFGPGIFTGPARWLEIATRTNGAASFSPPLTPRQSVTPSPYAIYAGSAGTASAVSSGAISAPQLNTPGGPGSGQVLAFDGTSLVWTNPASAAAAWNLTGNAGTTPGVNFLGTTDNQALQVKANNKIAIQYSPGSSLPNVVGGLSAFRPTVIRSGVSGAVVAGGNAPSGGVSGFGGGDFHAVYDNDGAVGGGFGNKVGSDNADVTDAAFATVGGGVFNGAAAYAAVVGGGDGNLAGGQRSGILGGFGNQALANFSFLGGGFQNFIQTNAQTAAIAGGLQNKLFDSFAFIGSGTNNTSSAHGSVIAGGYLNTIQTNAYASTIAGGLQNSIGSGSSLDSGAYAFIGAGQGNTIQQDGEAAVIAGGLNNTIQYSCQVATIGGGAQNSILHGPGFFDYAPYATIAGGTGNSITGAYYATITGGRDNKIGNASSDAAIGGGYINSIGASSSESTIAGGIGNSIANNAQNATIGGGTFNSCLANISTVPGGYQNVAGFSSFAAGTQARATNDTCFVWADNQGVPFGSTVNNQVSFRCSGGVRFVSGSGGGAQNVSWTPGVGSWSFSSDRNLKEDFKPIDTEQILDKVAALPITEWNYKGYPQRHIGAMAQDFQAAFPLNESRTTLNDADLHGVALAAIQGLNQKLKAKDSEIQELKQGMAELKNMLEKLSRRQQNSGD